MRVALFIPCYVDQLYPRVGLATVRVLQQVGVRAEFPEEQTCCGQPMANAGVSDAAAPLARKFLDVFSAYDAVVCPSGSCTSMVRNHYEHYVGEDPRYEPSVKECFAAEAMRRGEPVLSVIYDALLEQEGEALLYFPLYNYTGMNLDVVHEMLAHPLALPGLSDGGAHVGTVCDASFPTFLMTHWARDREKRFALEKMVKMQAHDTSRFVGLTDRGTIEVGMKADLNVIDFDHLRLLHPKMQRDLPAGGQRLMQRAEGYVATIASGVVIAEGGRLTGARPGRLVRAGH